MSNPVVRPPIPMSLAHRPVAGGLAQPWANVQLADGGTDFRVAHHARYAQCWQDCLCQSCGNPASPLAVLMCGPRQILSRKFDEPPLCPPCALYVSRACPVVSGRVEVYPDRPKVSAGRRGHTCPDPGCDCGGWAETDPEHSADMGGQMVLPWYACWIHPAGYTVTAHKAVTRCSDLGCEHERLIINGGMLTAAPIKILFVSEPGTGRIWRKLTGAEARAHATAVLGGTPTDVAGRKDRPPLAKENIMTDPEETGQVEATEETETAEKAAEEEDGSADE